jgi:hypothetical protein
LPDEYSDQAAQIAVAVCIMQLALDTVQHR